MVASSTKQKPRKALSDLLHIPTKRLGSWLPYTGVSTVDLTSLATGERMATVAQSAPSVALKDRRDHAGRLRKQLLRMPFAERCARMEAAADFFLNGELPIGVSLPQDSSSALLTEPQLADRLVLAGPDEYCERQSDVMGLTRAMCGAAMQGIADSMINVGRSLGQHLELLGVEGSIEDMEAGRIPRYCAQGIDVGLLSPNNAPGHFRLCTMIPAGGFPIIQKPGRLDVFTGMRFSYALDKAGFPPGVMGVYPAEQSFASQALSACDRLMLFGQTSTVQSVSKDPIKCEYHGSGNTAVIISDDVVDNWRAYLSRIVKSVVAFTSGRSCICAVRVYASRHTREIAAALAKALGKMKFNGLCDDSARIAAMADADAAERMWQMVEQGLSEDGVEHMTAGYGPRLVRKGGLTALEPVVAHTSNPDGAIACMELPFPLVAVVELPQSQVCAMLEKKPALICSVMTERDDFVQTIWDCEGVKFVMQNKATVEVDVADALEGNFWFWTHAIPAVPEPIVHEAPRAYHYV